MRSVQLSLCLTRLALGCPPAACFCPACLHGRPQLERFHFQRERIGLIDRLEQLGVVIDRLERCGPWAERAAYSMGVNRLCLSQGLRDQPGLQLDVLTHEAIHVVQDCLDGLEAPSSSTISLMLQARGGLSPAQVDRFLAHHLDRSTADARPDCDSVARAAAAPA